MTLSEIGVIVAIISACAAMLKSFVFDKISIAVFKAESSKRFEFLESENKKFNELKIEAKLSKAEKEIELINDDVKKINELKIEVSLAEIKKELSYIRMLIEKKEK